MNWTDRIRAAWLRFKLFLYDCAEAYEQGQRDRDVSDIDPSDIPMPGESTDDGAAMQAIESVWTDYPQASPEHGEIIGQGQHTIPYGRELRVVYEDARRRVVIRREAWWNGEKKGSRTVKLDKDPEMGIVVDTEGPPELPPREWAEAHFKYDPEREITDQWFMCLRVTEDIEDYPLNPVEIGP